MVVQNDVAHYSGFHLCAVANGILCQSNKIFCLYDDG